MASFPIYSHPWEVASFKLRDGEPPKPMMTTVHGSEHSRDMEIDAAHRCGRVVVVKHRGTNRVLINELEKRDG